MVTLIIVIAVALLNLFLGFFVFWRNRHSFTHRLIFSLALIFTAWSIFNYFSLNSYGEEETLFWIRMVMVVTAPLGPVVLLLLKAFPSSKIDLGKRFVYILIFLSCVVSILAITPLVFSSVVIEDGNITPTPGPGIALYMLLFFGSLLWGVISAIRRYKKARGIAKLQYRYLFIGVIATFALQVTTNFIAVVFFKFSGFVALGPSFSLIFIGFVTYAIARHRLLDIKFALRKGISKSITILVIFSLLFSAATIYLMIYEKDFENGQLFSIGLLTILVVLVYEPIASFIKRVSDKYLFSGVYNPSELLYNLSLTLSSSIAFEDTLQNINKLLTESLHISSITFALKLEGRENYPVSTNQSDSFAVYSYGDKRDATSSFAFLSMALDEFSNCILAEDADDNSENTSKLLVELKSWLKRNNYAVFLPLRVKNRPIGVILLGEKRFGDAYTAEDISILETFSLQAAIAIENILLFMHSRDFNERLKVEVSDATSELQQKNRNLEILRKMDSLIMTNLDSKEISQKIVDTIAWELGYDGALLEILDYKRSVLVPTAVSNAPLLMKAIALLPRPIGDYTTPLNSKTGKNVQSLLLKTKITTTSFSEAFELIPKDISNSMQESMGTKGIIIYPIMSKDQPLGVLTLALHKSPHEVTAEEHNILDAFMDEVAIALENAYLYEEARNVNTMLYKTNKDLVGLDKMKDEFVSIASHELRTPMTAINGYVWMLLQGKGGQLSEKQKYYLERVSQSTQRLINLVNDMLSVSRIESGRIQITTSDFDIVDSVKSVHEELQIKADEKKIEFSYTAKSPVMKVKADPDKVREVITNLLGNAMKFTDKGSITTRIDEKDGQIYVSVTDTGRGVSAEDMPKLFKKFGRLDNTFSTVAATSGTGLGLYICKTYIESMGGRFEVQSELGKGSTFAFYLPKSG